MENKEFEKIDEQTIADGAAESTDILYVEELPEQTDLALPAGTWGSFACLGSATCPSTLSSGSTASSASAA